MMKFKIEPSLEGVNSNRYDRRVRPNICVDMDGTLATFDKFVSWDHFGEPIQETVDRIKHWRDLGIEVRILTARMSEESRALDGITREQMEGAIKAWCRKNLGFELPVYSEKGPGMLFLLDDSVIQVQRNTGLYVAPEPEFEFRDEFNKAIDIDTTGFTEVDQGSISGDVDLYTKCPIPCYSGSSFLFGLRAAGLVDSIQLGVYKNERAIQLAFRAESKQKPVSVQVSLYTRVYKNGDVVTKYCVAQVNTVNGVSTTYVNFDNLNYAKFGKYIGEKIMA